MIDMIELMGLVLALILVISGIALFFLFFKATSQQPSKNRRKTPSSTRSSSFERAYNSSHLEKRLMTLLHGDQKVAHRLINSIQKRFPEKDRIWCLEKVISDIERDRS
jgi:hypothetical protein